MIILEDYRFSGFKYLLKGKEKLDNVKFSNRKCPFCNRKATQQFITLFHCKCGMSFIREGKTWRAFERTSDMVFRLTSKKPKRAIVQRK